MHAVALADQAPLLVVHLRAREEGLAAAAGTIGAGREYVARRRRLAAAGVKSRCALAGGRCKDLIIAIMSAFGIPMVEGR